MSFVSTFTLELLKVSKSIDNSAEDKDKVVMSMRIMNHLGIRLTQTATVYFIFQAYQVKIKLQAQSIEDYNAKILRNQK